MAILLLLLTAPVATGHQQPDLAAFHRQVEALDDTARLAALVRVRLHDGPADDAATQLELGLLHLRIHRLTREKRPYDRARDAFDRAKDLRPDDAWSHYADALSRAYGPDVGLGGSQMIETGRSLAQELGLDARTKARVAVERALELDPAFAPAAVLFSEIALFGREHEEMVRARDALARVIARGAADDRTLIALSRVAEALDDTEAALDAAERAARRDASPEALHAVAVALLRTPGREADGANAFFALVETMTPELAARLWREIAPIADTTEARQWQEADLDGRKQLMRDFWAMRAATSAVTVPERVAEHYRRLAFVVDSFPRVSNGAQPGEGTLLRDRDGAPFDERGIVWLRHGAPDRRVRSGGELNSGACGFSGPAVYNESWLYERVDGPPRFIHFLRCLQFPDWVVPYSTPCAPTGVPGAFTGGRGRRWEKAITYTLDRQAHDDDVTMCGPRTPERTRDFARERLAEDSHLPRFEAEIPFGMDLLAFRAADGRTDLSSPVAVQADSIPPDTLADGQLAYRLALSMFVVDTIAKSVVQSDTVVTYRTARAPAPGEALVAYVNATAEPTEDALLRIVVRDADDASRGRLHGAHIRVPSYAGDTLMVSSIVLAVPGEGGNWRRGDTELSVMPIGEFAGGAFRVFYEVYNLAQDTPYRTEIIVERAQGDLDRLIGEVFTPGDRPLIRLRFDGVAAPDSRGVVSELRSVETGLEPGRYRVYVRVIDLERERTVTTQRLFLVHR